MANQPGGAPQHYDINSLFKPSTNPNPNPIPSSSSYPPPPGPPYPYPQPYPHYHPHQIPNSNPNYPHYPIASAPNPDVRLMAMLSAPLSNQDLPPVTQPSIPSQLSSEFMPPAGSVTNPVQHGVMRMNSSKLPKGRRLVGDDVVYDIDVRVQGEVQPQLEVTPITKYSSDPQLVVGRQIAVNKTYICYGLKMGNIRVLNINTALRSLLKGHGSRVSDTAFFAEDVHLLASASVNGKFYVWKLSEVPDKDDKPEITEKVVVAIQLEGGGDAVHPRVCWHCHKQEVLVIGMGTRILRLDTTKVGKGKTFSAEEPLKISVDKLIDGVQLVGMHEGEVTDLSMCQWMTTRLVSSSTDGTIKIWEDRKAVPLLSLRPHDGNPVSSATFLSAPNRPDHIILITGGLLNQEIRFWASGGDEGWLLPSDAESWKCIQTLKLTSTSEPNIEDMFFNQVVALPQPGLILVANAKKNAIYTVHVDYGSNPASTRMDYIAEFSVTMPILSFTGTSELLPNGENIVQLYCVQTQAIQQYALNISHFLPPQMDNSGLVKGESINAITAVDDLPLSESRVVRPVETVLARTAPKASAEDNLNSDPGAKILNVDSSEIVSIHKTTTSISENKTGVVSSIAAKSDINLATSPSLSTSPRLSSKISGFSNQSNNYEPSPALSEHGGDVQVTDYSVDRQVDDASNDSSDLPSVNDLMNNEKKVVQTDVLNIDNPPATYTYKSPHLITPADIFAAASSSDSANIVESMNHAESKFQDVTVDNVEKHNEVDLEVVRETGGVHDNPSATMEEPRDNIVKRERYFCSQASNIGIQMTREFCALPSEIYDIEEAKQTPGVSDKRLNVVDESTNSLKGVLDRESGSSVPLNAQQAEAISARGKRQKDENAKATSSSSPSVLNSLDSITDQAVQSNFLSSDTAASQMHTVLDKLNQLLAMHQDSQKQAATFIVGPTIKEIKRLEAAFGRTLEKALKASADANMARFQELSVKNDKVMKDRLNQITDMITGLVNKDIPSMVEKMIKKEMAAAVPSLARTITPTLEKTISSGLTEAFQRGVGDKLGTQLEKSLNAKLEATVARQIQAQFQTSAKQALQESMKSCLETYVVPAFELSCNSMFEQIDASFKKGLVEHTTVALQHFETQNSTVALALRDAMISVSSITQTLSSEFVESQRKLIALASAGVNSNGVNPLAVQPSNGPLGSLHDQVEAPVDPTRELSRLISENKYEEAFTTALQRSDVAIVSWLCSQVDLQKLLSATPVPLSQGVLLSLLQQLACDIQVDTAQKLTWMTDVAVAIIPTDPMIAVHVRPIFEQVYQILNHHRTLPSVSAAEVTSIRLVMHVINSILTTCK